MDYILNTAYHLFPDSAAAKDGGEKKKGAKKDAGEGRTSDEQANNRQLAFAYLMRGVHW
jgi:hypothetical protein